MSENTIPPDQDSEVTPAAPVKKKMGAPTKLNPEVQEQFCDLLRKGNYFDTAAHYLGIDPRTMYYWLDKGYAQKSGAHHNFFQAVKKAAAEAEVNALERVQEGGGIWQRAAWFLERRYPDRYARREYIQDSRDVKEIPQDELDELIQQALAVKMPKLVEGGSHGEDKG